jgi:hypothetical protein
VKGGLAAGSSSSVRMLMSFWLHKHTVWSLMVDGRRRLSILLFFLHSHIIILNPLFFFVCFRWITAHGWPFLIVAHKHTHEGGDRIRAASLFFSIVSFLSFFEYDDADADD